MAGEWVGSPPKSSFLPFFCKIIFSLNMYLSAVCLHPMEVNVSWFLKAGCAAALVFSELLWNNFHAMEFPYEISMLWKSSRIKKNLNTFLLY